MTSRKSRMVAVFVGLLVLAGLAGSVALAADKAASSLVTARGVVKSASATALVLDPEAPGKEMRFVLDEHTVVMGMKPLARIPATDLRKGDPVTVSYAEEGGRSVAKRVWRRPADSTGNAPAKAKPAAAH